MNMQNMQNNMRNNSATSIFCILFYISEYVKYEEYVMTQSIILMHIFWIFICILKHIFLHILHIFLHIISYPANSFAYFAI